MCGVYSTARVGVPLVVVNVHGSCTNNEKSTLWNEIADIKRNQSCTLWGIMGDFNAMRKVEERKGIGISSGNYREMELFNNFIEQCEVFDIPMIGGKYRFRPNGGAKSRIDRVLVSEDWLERWPNTKQYIMVREVSDHCAIVVKEKVLDWGLKPFKLFDVW